MPWSRQTKAWFASVLLLLHALLPALHEWTHALEAAAEHVRVCADCGRSVDSALRAAAPDDGRATLDHCHTLPDDCGLCLVLQAGTNHLLPTAPAVHAQFAPPVHRVCDFASERRLAAAILPPPARAPPSLRG